MVNPFMSLITAHQNAIAEMTHALFAQDDFQILAWETGLAVGRSEVSGEYIVGALWKACEFGLGASRPAVINGEGLTPVWQSRKAAIRRELPDTMKRLQQLIKGALKA